MGNNNPDPLTTFDLTTVHQTPADRIPKSFTSPFSPQMAKNKSDRCSSATTRRLKMYKSRPKRDRKGKMLKHDFQLKKLPSTRIQPDSRWFIHTRVISQEKLKSFREDIHGRLSSKYNVILNKRNLPMSLVKEQKKKGKAYQLNSESATGTKKKRAKHFESLAKKANTS